MVADSGHGIQVEQPQAVIDAVESVLVRGGSRRDPGTASDCWWLVVISGWG